MSGEITTSQAIEHHWNCWATHVQESTGLRVLPLTIFDCCLTSFSESAMSQKTLKPVQRKGDSFTSKKISKAIELTSSSSAASASALQTLQAVQAFSSGQWHPSPDKYPTCIQFSDLVSFMESNESNNHWGYDRIWHGSNDKNKGKICKPSDPRVHSTCIACPWYHPQLCSARIRNETSKASMSWLKDGAPQEPHSVATCCYHGWWWMWTIPLWMIGMCFHD